MTPQHYTYERLEGLLHRWRFNDEMPESANRLSHAEWRALALAAYYPFEDPLHAFLSLDGWLAKWVLEKRHLEEYIGRQIGVD